MVRTGGGVKTVSTFSGEYRFLSNFFPAEVILDDDVYPTVEHAYQAAKTVDAGQRELVRQMPLPYMARAAGRRLTLRGDWEQVKVAVMRALLAQKFVVGSLLSERLLATGDAHLEEGNSWGDRFWGVCNGSGQNVLGRLLMEVRSRNRSVP